MSQAKTTEELVEMFKELNSKREGLLVRVSKVQANVEQALKERDRFVKEMEELGTSPEKIADDELLARQELQKILEEYNKELESLEGSVVKAEKLFKGESDG